MADPEQAAPQDEEETPEPEAESGADASASPETAPQPPPPDGPALAQDEPTPEAQEPRQLQREALQRMLPDDLQGVRVPFIAVRLPAHIYLGLVVVGLLSCVAIIFSVVHRRDGGAVPFPEAETGGEPETAPPDEFAKRWTALPYDEIMDMADRRSADGDSIGAAGLYRSAAEREGEGPAKTAFASFRLAQMLVAQEEYGEALRIFRSLEARSRPGDQLWLHALVETVTILSRGEDWRELWRTSNLLQANLARYPEAMAPDGELCAVEAWTVYSKAMARVRMFLAQAGQAGRLYDVDLPPYGRAPCVRPPLQAEQITIRTSEAPPAGLSARPDAHALVIEADGVPVGDVVDAVAAWGGPAVTYDPADAPPVTCLMRVVAPAVALEVILGSVGLQARRVGDEWAVQPFAAKPDSPEQARKVAMDALYDLLTLYPECPQVDEAYFALAHLFLAGRDAAGEPATIAMDQFENMTGRFPRSPWTVYGRYVTGRAALEAGDYERAERELLRAHDGVVRHPLKLPALRHAATAQMALDKHLQAASCLRQCLALGPPEELVPELLYGLACCMEESGASRREVARRYLELVSRFPNSEEAVLADYRRARMAFDAGDYAAAAARYEHFLARRPMRGDVGQKVCAELVQCYANLGQHYRVVLLGEVMSTAMSDSEEFRRVLPILLDACKKAGLGRIGLSFLDRARQQTSDEALMRRLDLERASFLLTLGRYAEGSALLKELEGCATDPGDLYDVCLLRARACLAQGEPERGLDLCRLVARSAGPLDPVRAEALRIMGSYYESHDEYDKAALLYSGKLPVEQEGSSP